VAGPYRTISRAWCALLNTTGRIEAHNHSGDPDIPAVYTAAVHHADGTWDTYSPVPALD
jgi:hypothetical protein